ncbi:MAG: amino acid permease [Thermoanaerobacteraceae bacterium]|nr:amino acid permease [Thermoanaerobacteraceae bacterium]
MARALGPFDLVALGIGAIIGTGIFVITGVAAAQYAGPALVLSFVVSGIAAGLAALTYAELAAMIPVAGSAYTYAYASLGEFIAWIVGWNIILEYLVAAGAVAVGWSAYFGEFLHSLGVVLPAALTHSPAGGGVVNLPAVLIALLVTALVTAGTRESSAVNKIVVAVKIGVILLFIFAGARHVDPANWRPFFPYGQAGIMHGAAIIFFAYIGFDAVATAAEETRSPQRNLPVGIIGSLAVCTVLYILVTLVLTGLVPYTELNVASPVATALVRAGITWAGGVVALGALAGITSVLLVVIYAQSRIFFAMSRDGLLPGVLSRVHPRFRTPYVNTLLVGTGVALLAGFLPIDIIAQLANIGTLTAFSVVAVGVLVLRKTNPDAPRPFRVPFSPYLPLLSLAFSVYLILSLPPLTWLRFVVWMGFGIAVYLLYGYRKSALAPAGRRLGPLPPPVRKVRPQGRR